MLIPPVAVMRNARAVDAVIFEVDASLNLRFLCGGDRPEFLADSWPSVRFMTLLLVRLAV